MVSSLGCWLMFLADFYQQWNSPRGVSVKPSSLLSGAGTTARIWVQGFQFAGRDEREWLSWLKVFVFFLLFFLASQRYHDVTWCQSDVSYCKVQRESWKIWKMFSFQQVNVKRIVLQDPLAAYNWPGVSAMASEEQSHGGGIKRCVSKPSAVF